jgi:DNA-3-methyladenine glycosylase I
MNTQQQPIAHDGLRGAEDRPRCGWVKGDPLMMAYHDTEWGVPLRDSRALWEILMLEGFQAGLSWQTILRRREGFRAAFAGFVPEVVATFGARDVTRLMADTGIIRARAKIEATIGNAQAYLAMAAAGEDFSSFAWRFTDGKTLTGDGHTVPASTDLSQQISVALKRRGFKFVGAVTVYAWMQAVGIVNDHAVNCFRRACVASEGKATFCEQKVAKKLL